MNRFSIKDIELLSGIKAHTLRIWEQRYSILVPKRKESNHRFYNNDDLKSLLQIAYLYHNGVKISKIATLKVHERQEVSKTLAEKEVGSTFFVNRLLEAFFDFDENKFNAVFDEALQRDGLENTIVDVAYPYLDKIGLLWMTDQSIPAQEHLTSHIILIKIIEAIDDLPHVSQIDGLEVLLFTPQKDHHEIPISFIYYLLKKNGYNVVYFGTNSSLTILEQYCKTRPATYLFCHLITNFTAQPLHTYVAQLQEIFKDKSIILSGPKTVELSNAYSNVILLQSMEELLATCKQLPPHHLT